MSSNAAVGGIVALIGRTPWIVIILCFIPFFGALVWAILKLLNFPPSIMSKVSWIVILIMLIPFSAIILAIVKLISNPTA